MMLLWMVFVFTTFFAFNQASAWPYLLQVSKIFLMIFVTMMVINTPEKYRYLLLVIGLSVGLIGLKGGIWAIVTGGQHRVYGPAASFMADNNDFALALNMALPMLFYLAKDENRPWLKLALKISFVFGLIAVIFTYSRGGFLTMGLVVCLLLFKAKYKSLAIVCVAIGFLIATWIVPQKWSTRMETIETYEQDNSARGRIIAWKMAWNLALDRPLTGGGFNTFIQPVYARYSTDDPGSARDVHSIYFEMLGEQGFIGFGLFLLIILSCLTTIVSLKRQVKRTSNLHWALHYPDMLQVSIAAYLVGGTFLGRAYFDMFYHLVASIAILQRLALDPAVRPVETFAKEPPEPSPRFSRPAFGIAQRPQM
jgi:probable O-glycosylation ligase (exosortase A-associated)